MNLDFIIQFSRYKFNAHILILHDFYVANVL